MTRVPAVVIREGPDPGAIEAIVRLHADYYGPKWGFGPHFAEIVRRECWAFMDDFRRVRHGLWLALADERIVGSVAIQVLDGGARVRWFIVDAAVRGQGVGHRLLDAAMDFCRARAFEVVELETYRGLDAACHLYEQHGFRLEHSVPDDRWGPTLTELRYAWRPA